jgi:multidrug efflux pump subunit AcrA (membrane-fusion protein)
MLPQDALVAEDVRFEVQFLQMPDPAADPGPGRPVGSDVQLRIISSGAEPYTLPHVGPGEKPGTYTSRYRFTDSGQYAIAASTKAGGETINAEFPVVVGAGPVFRTTMLLDLIVLLIFGALIVSRWRSRTASGSENPGLSRDVAIAGAGVAVLIGAHVWLGPQVGRMFLPERHFGGVAWDMGAPPGAEVPSPAAPHVDPPGTPPHTHPPGTPPHTHPPKGKGSGDPPPGDPDVPRDIVSTVVPVPGHLVDVMVPASARVLFGNVTPHVGRQVRRGQTLATLEYNYIVHDAVHLVNQRWLYLVPMLATKRASLEADLTAARTRYLARNAEPSVRQAMQVMQAVQTADLAAATARLESQRAAKLLAMHTAEISESDLVRRPIVSPIDGTIEEVSFTHGQLKYENDKIFTILDLSRVWVEARFPEETIARRPPSRMRFASPAFPSAKFEGRLVRVSNTLDSKTGTLAAFFEVLNPDRLLRVGMRLSAESPVTEASTTGTQGAPRTTSAANTPSTPVALAAIVKAKPDLRADVVAPLWGRIDFARRRLSVGDYVTKDEDLAHVILELAADERYQMNARAVDIAAERELSRTRREQAEKRWQEAVAQLKANPADAFRKEEADLLNRVYEAAREEESLLVRQVEVYKDVIKRRDPKTTIVKAPISGVITEIGFRPGELNRTDDFRHLFTIVNTSSVWLEAQVYDHQRSALLSGFTRASFTSSSVDSPRPLGRPVAVSGLMNPETGALSVIFDVANPGGALKIGGSARIVVPRN